MGKKRTSAKTPIPNKKGDRREANSKARAARMEVYSEIPKGDWVALAGGLARATIDDHARSTGLPVDSSKIDLAAVVVWLHKSIKGNRNLWTGEGAPLERKREAEANIAEIREAELKGELIPRDQLHDILGRAARHLRGFGEMLKKRGDTDTLASFDKMLVSFRREIAELKTDE